LLFGKGKGVREDLTRVVDLRGSNFVEDKFQGGKVSRFQ